MMIRQSSPEECPGLPGLVVAAYQEYAPALGQAAWEQMRSSLLRVPELAATAVLLIAEHAGQLAGSVLYFPPGTSDEGIFPRHWASIRLLAVSPEQRGQGIGRLLTEACLARARQDQAELLGLHTSELMTTARQMYERMGFRQDRDLPSRFGIRYWRFVLPLGASSRKE